MPVTSAKLVLAAFGLVVWGYGIQSSVRMLQWLGIAMLTAAVILRFLGKRDTSR